MDIRFLFVFLGAAAGGAVQSVAGFGGGVLMMLFLPSMFGLLHHELATVIFTRGEEA